MYMPYIKCWPSKPITTNKKPLVKADVTTCCRVLFLITATLSAGGNTYNAFPGIDNEIFIITYGDGESISSKPSALPTSKLLQKIFLQFFPRGDLNLLAIGKQYISSKFFKTFLC